MNEYDKVARLRALISEAAPPVKPATLTADDTLGRILRRAEPYAARFARIFGVIGLVCLPIRVVTLCVAAPSLLETATWAAQHQPFWMFKFIGGVAALSLFWLSVSSLYMSEVHRWRLKRRLKNEKSGVDAGFNSQT